MTLARGVGPQEWGFGEGRKSIGPEQDSPPMRRSPATKAQPLRPTELTTVALRSLEPSRLDLYWLSIGKMRLWDPLRCWTSPQAS